MSTLEEWERQWHAQVTAAMQRQRDTARWHRAALAGVCAGLLLALAFAVTRPAKLAACESLPVMTLDPTEIRAAGSDVVEL